MCSHPGRLETHVVRQWGSVERVQSQDPGDGAASYRLGFTDRGSMSGGERIGRRARKFAQAVHGRGGTARPTNLKATRGHRGAVAIPATAPGRTLETIRTAARRRLLLASSFVALGVLFLVVAQTFVVAFIPVGATSSLILGALLLVLGLSAGAYGVVLFSRAFPLSESALSARLALLASLLVVLPVCAGVAVVYILVALPESAVVEPTSLVLVPAIPFFWGPSCSLAAVGFVYAARELASERMAVAAAMGCGVVIGMSLSAALGALIDPLRAVQSVRLVGDLLLVAGGFVPIALAFQMDPWAARSRRAP